MNPSSNEALAPQPGPIFDTEAFEQYRLRDITRIIYEQDWVAAGGNAVTALLMFFYVNGHLNPAWIYCFLVVFGLGNLMMLIMNRQFTKVRENQSTSQYKRWILGHRAVDFFNNMTFSVGIYLLSISVAPQNLWVATIAGVLYSCAVVLTVSLDLGCFLSSLPVIIFTLTWIQATQGSLFLAVGFIAFLLFALVLVKDLQKGYIRSLTLGFDNLYLAKNLELEKSKAIAGQKVAEEANLDKSRFFAAANHDLRQPLHALVLGIEQLKIRVEDKGAEESLVVVDTAAKSLVTLFGQLMEVAKLDSQNQRVRLIHFRMQPLLDRVRDEFSPMARDKHIRFIVKPCSKVAFSDELSVERMLRNLIGNALKFTDQGTVLVACRSSGSDLRVQVWDTGMGIDSDNLQDIFDEFKQLNPQEQRRGQASGMGLGLSIVRRLAQLIGTSVTVASTPGKGSKFEFTIAEGNPETVIDINEELQIADSVHEPLKLAQGLVVYLLEDDELGGSALKSLLNAWGAQVKLFHTTESLWSELKTSNAWPDLFILDYQIGKQTSLPVIDELMKKGWQAFRLLVISGVQSAQLNAELESRNVSLMLKPINPNALFERIKYLGETV